MLISRIGYFFFDSDESIATLWNQITRLLCFTDHPVGFIAILTGWLCIMPYSILLKIISKKLFHFFLKISCLNSQEIIYFHHRQNNNRAVNAVEIQDQHSGMCLLILKLLSPILNIYLQLNHPLLPTLKCRGVASGGKRVTECIGPRGLGVPRTPGHRKHQDIPFE